MNLTVGKQPAVPRKFRNTFIKRRAARTALGRILEWLAKKLLMAHGTPVERDGQALIARALRWPTGCISRSHCSEPKLEPENHCFRPL
jgi:hypothetical protein